MLVDLEYLSDYHLLSAGLVLELVTHLSPQFFLVVQEVVL